MVFLMKITNLGIPVEIHPKHKMYVPSLIFGELMAGENFDDNVKRIVGGRNGLGAKLANIFSTEFQVELVDKRTDEEGEKVNKYFKQVFRNNLDVKEEPEVKKINKAAYTTICFKPDLKRFGMTHLDKDILALFRKRVYDVAGCHPSLKVFYNDKEIEIKSFLDYCKLYLDADVPLIHDKQERWEIAFTINPSGDFQQVSFVNSIATTKGGTHVRNVVDKIVKPLREFVESKNKGAKIQPAQIKGYMWIFIKSLIENPSFNSQHKEELNTPAKEFGSSWEISDTFVKKGKIHFKTTLFLSFI